ncbi:hypothetical protein TRFO_12473 [Tritrichomonas foetus]|uniref:Sortilin N-terminal domain-containing protein n=1 Tax=Tritrichomonas foetus TaxID=1144522 RepID=A0A1J4L1C3_9EUKA|nr:hypothetical protein TRFO_12473 [Tritrichomonas foetus]|eukprot:OHT17319.1 hypothetical protein TRFO_12473 [Tritrichomonas foetus]
MVGCQFHITFPTMNETLLQFDESATTTKTQSSRVNKLCIILLSVFALIAVIATGLLVYFFLPRKIGQVLIWREVLRCRKDKSDVSSAMQLATLYNTNRGVILAGGGSDIHENTCSPTLFRSIDDGETWTKVYVGQPDMFSLYSFQELSNGDFVGLVPDYFLRSTDGGLNWTIQNLTGTGFSMKFNPDDNILIVSKNPNEIYISNDYGQTFRLKNYCPEGGCDNLRAITYAGNRTWYLGVGEDEGHSNISHARVFKSTDNGENWEKVFEILNDGDYKVIFSVFAYSTEEVLIGVDGDSENHPGIYKSSNGGKNWTHVCDTFEEFDPSIKIVRSFFKDEDNDKLFACLDCSYASSHTWADEPDANRNSMVIVSEDRGTTWKAFSRTGTKRLYWMTKTKDGNYLVTTGEYGQILKSSFMEI